MQRYGLKKKIDFKERESIEMRGLFKFLERIFNPNHIHCFSDKKYDFTDKEGQRIIIMACNKCGLEETHVLVGSTTK